MGDLRLLDLLLGHKSTLKVKVDIRSGPSPWMYYLCLGSRYSGVHSLNRRHFLTDYAFSRLRVLYNLPLYEGGLIKPFGHPLTGFVAHWNYPDFTAFTRTLLFFADLCYQAGVTSLAKPFNLS
jgi:hypothetical protein